MTPPNISTASGVQASNLVNSSRLRSLICEPSIPRPRQLPSRGRIIPVGRPMRGRAIFDPQREAIRNSLATRHGKPIKKNDKLTERCECCSDCVISCALPKYDFYACGPCTPRSLQAGIGGVELCDCTNLDDPPRQPPDPGTWGRMHGSVGGVYCARPDGAPEFFVAGPCVYIALLPASSEFFVNATDCGGVAGGYSDYCALIIELIAGAVPMLQARITTNGGAHPLFSSAAEIFWGQTTFKGWQATHVISNILTDCGPWPPDADPFLPGTWILGKLGTIVITACCT